jgi:hypothetical protein
MTGDISDVYMMNPLFESDFMDFFQGRYRSWRKVFHEIHGNKAGKMERHIRSDFFHNPLAHLSDFI